MNTRSQYQPRMISAARRVLLELASIFDDEREKMVFVGGTACALLFPQDTDPHEGTIDVDIALNTTALAVYDDDTLEDKLMYALYQQEPGKKYRWIRSVLVDGDNTPVKIDLLTGEYEDSRRASGSREVQGVHASVLRGLDLAFLDPRLVPLSGILPNESAYETEIRVCSPASLLAMKGIAVVSRLQGADKDAYDIDYILRRCDGGPDALARVLQTDFYWHEGLVQEGLQGIARAFESLNAMGPTTIASPDRYPDLEERAIVQQGTFQRVKRMLDGLGIRAGGVDGG